MNFAHPLAFLLLVLLVPLWLLYRRRERTLSQTVGTSVLWQKALAEEAFRWRWRRRRLKATVGLLTLIVLLLAVAAAGPQIPASVRKVLVIDNSATMRAGDVQPTRLDEAKKVALRLIGNLRSCDEMAVVTVGPPPVEVQPMTHDKGLLAAAVESISATAERADVDWAVRLAREVSPQVVLISDACCKAARQAQESGVEVLRVGTAAGNLAITRLTARRSRAEPSRCEVFVELQNQGDQPAQGKLSLAVDGNRGDPAAFSVGKDGRWRHVFPLELKKAARLKAQIEPGDAYRFDDAAELEVPAAPAQHRVRLVGEDRSGLKEILAANRRVELVSDDGQGKAIQVLVGQTPPLLPAGPVLVFSPSGCDAWQLGEAVADPLVSRVNDNSPVTAGLRLYDAYLPEARQLQIAPSLQAAAKPILWAGATPLGYAIERPQGRVVVIGGDLATSNLPLEAAFPQLLDQALDWLAGQEPWKDEVANAAGAIAKTAGAADLPAAHADPQATDIRVVADVGKDAAEVLAQQPWPPLWIALAAAAAALAIIEWCLYQRRWTC